MSNTPNRNQGRPENGGVAGQVHEQGQKVQEKAGEVGNRVREGYEQARDAASEGYRQAGEFVSGHPGSTLLVGFGLGFGLGVLATLLFRPEPESWYDRYVPDRLRNMHLPESLAHLPDSISRHIPGR